MILSIITALENLGYDHGFACNDVDGIILWNRDEPQPTRGELIAAGWTPIEPE